MCSKTCVFDHLFVVGWDNPPVMLGATNLGLHVEGAEISWQALQTEPGGAALVNWNNEHWTVLQFDSVPQSWVHTNSILGDGARHGRKVCSHVGEVSDTLAEIQQHYDGVALHRITAAVSSIGHRFLEREGLRAMLAPEDEELQDAEIHVNIVADDDPVVGAEKERLTLLTVNVDGIGDGYRPTPATRMEAILFQIIEASPDVILFQEVVPSMYAVLRQSYQSGSSIAGKKTLLIISM